MTDRRVALELKELARKHNGKYSYETEHANKKKGHMFRLFRNYREAHVVNRRNVSLRFPMQSLALEKDRFDTENTQGLLAGRDYFMQAFKDQKARRMVNAVKKVKRAIQSPPMTGSKNVDEFTIQSRKG
jgi:hypothetical protein